MCLVYVHLRQLVQEPGDVGRLVAPRLAVDQRTKGQRAAGRTAMEAVLAVGQQVPATEVGEVGQVKEALLPLPGLQNATIATVTSISRRRDAGCHAAVSSCRLSAGQASIDKVMDDG